MKKIICLLAVLTLLITALPSCASNNVEAFDLYAKAAKELAQTDSAAISATTTVSRFTGTSQEAQSTSTILTDFRFCGDDLAAKLSLKQNDSTTVQAEYTYLDGILYVDTGVSGNEKWKKECAKEDIASVSSMNINMDYALMLPVLTEDSFRDVVFKTDGTNRMITISVAQDKLVDWMSAVTGVGEVEESDEQLELTLIFDADGNISQAHLRFQIFLTGETIKIDLTLSYADIGAQKPLELPSPIESYRELTAEA